MKTIKIFVTSMMLILICYAGAYAFSSTKTTLVINNVVSETEKPYLETSKGTFSLPDFTNVVSMDTESLTELISILEANAGKEVKLCVYDGVVVGIAAYDKKTFAPKFKENKKNKYKDKPVKISTTMQFWGNYTLEGLFIVTSNGTYCIDNDYKYSDYHTKVYKKLISKIKMNEKTSLKIDVFFHKLSNDDGCTGAIEDIQF